MKYFLITFLLLGACQFHPLFENKEVQDVCVAPIPEAFGYQLQNELKKYFVTPTACTYTLQVTTPLMSLSDQSISNKDLITMQRVQGTVSYSLLDAKKKTLLKNSATATGSSAVVQNPYATVVSVEKTQDNLIPILAQKIALHISAYLNGLHQ